MIPETELSPRSQSMVRYDVGEEGEDRDRVGIIINRIEMSCFLLEPFERLHQAIAIAIAELAKKGA